MNGANLICQWQKRKSLTQPWVIPWVLYTQPQNKAYEVEGWVSLSRHYSYSTQCAYHSLNCERVLLPPRTSHFVEVLSLLCVQEALLLPGPTASLRGYALYMYDHHGGERVNCETAVIIQDSVYLSDSFPKLQISCSCANIYNCSLIHSMRMWISAGYGCVFPPPPRYKWMVCPSSQVLSVALFP